MAYTPMDWYWIVGGSGPHIPEEGGDYTGDSSQVFSSARNQYVPATDRQYLTWKDYHMTLRDGVDMTTRIDTEENLTVVLAPLGIVPPWAAATN